MESYTETLDQQALARYEEKLRFIGGLDPYKIELEKWSGDVKLFPEITYIDMVNYLVFHPSPFCEMKDFRNYKSMEAYDRFVSGWVRDVMVYKTGGPTVMKAKVLHSQRLSQPSLVPWIITDKSTILCAHCNCVAGLGESCSHVASLLFYIEATVRLTEVTTVTQEPAYWMLPSPSTTVNYEPLSKINFTSSKTLKQNLDKKIESARKAESVDIQPEAKQMRTKYTVPKSRYDAFFTPVLPDRPAVLSVNSEYSAHYIPHALKPSFPILLSELFDEVCQDLDYTELVERCRSVFDTLSISENEVRNVEAATKDQSNNKMWHRFRTGRITASRIKSACNTPLAEPSISLIKQICYPTEYKFQNAATEWGCTHEETARNRYQKAAEDGHSHLQLQQSGLFLSAKYPHLGASPDGLVECDCCGKGCLEIKCLYCMKDENVRAGKGSCLEDVVNGFRLKRNHPYYYQVQTQLFLSDTDYCDFVVWTEKDMFVERILPDPSLWAEIVEKSTKFFTAVILPELKGKYFSRKSTETKEIMKPLKQVCQNSLAGLSTASTPSTRKSKEQKPASKKKNRTTVQSQTQVYCICNGPESGGMIQCDSPECSFKPYEWFHFSCVKLKKEPVGQWYCPDCREIQFLQNLKESKRH